MLLFSIAYSLFLFCSDLTYQIVFSTAQVFQKCTHLKTNNRETLSGVTNLWLLSTALQSCCNHDKVAKQRSVIVIAFLCRINSLLLVALIFVISLNHMTYFIWNVRFWFSLCCLHFESTRQLLVYPFFLWHFYSNIFQCVDQRWVCGQNICHKIYCLLCEQYMLHIDCVQLALLSVSAVC